MQEAGFAERAPDHQDRRKIIISASDKARQLAEQVWGQTVIEAQAQLSRYTPAQLELLTEFVREQVELQQRQAHRIRTWSA